MLGSPGASHHDLEAHHRIVGIRGRGADIQIRHVDGAVEAVERLPSGRASRGVDEDDDGHLEQTWNGEAVIQESDQDPLTVLM